VPEDVDLLRAWAEGDAAAGKAFYRRHADRLAEFVARKIDRDAADLVQRVFLECVQAQRAGTQIEQPRAYLYAIARNALYDELSARRRHDDRIDPGVTSLRELGPSPSSRVARDERQRLLLAALEALPLDAQLALELYYWEELDMREVAQALGITRSAALNRIHRARAQLRERLAQSPASPEVERTLAHVSGWADPTDGDPDRGPGGRT
jgi:RNA polymerase sigma factor (sigma-70 family)